MKKITLFGLIVIAITIISASFQLCKNGIPLEELLSYVFLLIAPISSLYVAFGSNNKTLKVTYTFFSLGIIFFALSYLFVPILGVNAEALSDVVFHLGWHSIFYMSMISFIWGGVRIRQVSRNSLYTHFNIWDLFVVAFTVFVTFSIFFSIQNFNTVYSTTIEGSFVDRFGIHHLVAFVLAVIVAWYIFYIKKSWGKLVAVGANGILGFLSLVALQHLWELLTESLKIIRVTMDVVEGVETYIVIGALFFLCISMLAVIKKNLSVKGKIINPNNSAEPSTEDSPEVKTTLEVVPQIKALFETELNEIKHFFSNNIGSEKLKNIEEKLNLSGRGNEDNELGIVEKYKVAFDTFYSEIINSLGEEFAKKLYSNSFARVKSQYSTFLVKYYLSVLPEKDFYDERIKLANKEELVVVLQTKLKELERAMANLAISSEILERTGEMAKVGGWEIDLSNMKLFWSLETYKIHEVDPEIEPDIEKAINYYAPESQPIIRSAIQSIIKTGTSFDLELQFITAKQNHLWVRTKGLAIKEGSKIIKIIGAFQDITAQKLIEERLKSKSLEQEKFNKLITGREIKMIELKNKIKELEEKLKNN